MSLYFQIVLRDEEYYQKEKKTQKRLLLSFLMQARKIFITIKGKEIIYSSVYRYDDGYHTYFSLMITNKSFKYNNVNGASANSPILSKTLKNNDENF